MERSRIEDERKQAANQLRLSLFNQTFTALKWSSWGLFIFSLGPLIGGLKAASIIKQARANNIQDSFIRSARWTFRRMFIWLAGVALFLVSVVALGSSAQLTEQGVSLEDSAGAGIVVMMVIAACLVYLPPLPGMMACAMFRGKYEKDLSGVPR
jgi:uncharacterized membrane protein YkvI